jgi:tRNA(Ser,Leu) C12 N-acetylase TAN1
MTAWNVVVTVYEGSFKQAFELLQLFGTVRCSNFLNVLTLTVSNIPSFLETLKTRVEDAPGMCNILARVIPVTHTFTFHSPSEFEAKAREIALTWTPQLQGKGFHVRMHRRGFKGRLSSQDEERFLDEILLETLEKSGNPGHITFDHPDAIIAVETIGSWAGLSCWSRDELCRYPLLKLD